MDNLTCKYTDPGNLYALAGTHQQIGQYKVTYIKTRQTYANIWLSEGQEWIFSKCHRCFPTYSQAYCTVCLWTKYLKNCLFGKQFIPDGESMLHKCTSIVYQHHFLKVRFTTPNTLLSKSGHKTKNPKVTNIIWTYY